MNCILRYISLVFACFMAFGCAIFTVVDSKDQSYPDLSGINYNYAVTGLDYLKYKQKDLEEYRELNRLIEDVRYKKKFITQFDVNRINRLIKIGKNVQETKERDRLAQAKEREEKESLRKKEVEEDRVISLKNNYKSDFDKINSSFSAEEFIKKYEDYDPDGLRRAARMKWYQYSIDNQKRCIYNANRAIAYERQIGQRVGYENKNNIYQAGRNLIICEEKLKQLNAGYRKEFKK